MTPAARLCRLAAVYEARAVGWERSGRPFLAADDRRKVADIRWALEQRDAEGAENRSGAQERAK